MVGAFSLARMDTPNTDEQPVEGILAEFTGLENILSHFRKIDPNEVESVSPETLKGYIAFGALMCYTNTEDDTDRRGFQELSKQWQNLAVTLGVGTAQPAEAGAAG
jgi:hypothetical protein